MKIKKGSIVSILSFSLVFSACFPYLTSAQEMQTERNDSIDGNEIPSYGSSTFISEGVEYTTGVEETDDEIITTIKSEEGKQFFTRKKVMII